MRCEGFRRSIISNRYNIFFFVCVCQMYLYVLERKGFSSINLFLFYSERNYKDSASSNENNALDFSFFFFFVGRFVQIIYIYTYTYVLHNTQDYCFQTYLMRSGTHKYSIFFCILFFILELKYRNSQLPGHRQKIDIICAYICSCTLHIILINNRLDFSGNRRTRVSIQFNHVSPDVIINNLVATNLLVDGYNSIKHFASCETENV